MPFSQRATSEQIKLFKSAAIGLTGRIAGEAIVKSIMAHYVREVTVLDRFGHNELFRLGTGPKHGVTGIHVHPTKYHGLEGNSLVSTRASDLMTDAKFNEYVGTLLQALETGCFRVGSPK